MGNGFFDNIMGGLVVTRADGQSNNGGLMEENWLTMGIGAEQGAGTEQPGAVDASTDGKKKKLKTSHSTGVFSTGFGAEGNGMGSSKLR